MPITFHHRTRDPLNRLIVWFNDEMAKSGHRTEYAPCLGKRVARIRRWIRRQAIKEAREDAANN